MLISISELITRFNVHPSVVLHVGAHEGEEYFEMKKHGWGSERIIWVESQENLARKLKDEFKDTQDSVHWATAWSATGVTKTFYETSNTQSSSLYELGTHTNTFPDILPTRTYQVVTSRLDSIVSPEDKIDLINLDIQGAELEALVGLGNVIQGIKWVYTEVNRGDVYKGCAKVWEIDSFLKKQGFKRIATRWSKDDDWGDALYTREFVFWKYLRYQIDETFNQVVTFLRYWVHDLKVMVYKVLKRK